MKYSKNGYKRNSKDRNNPYNIIPSGNITMKGVDFPVLGTDNLGNQKLMMPGANYVFPGNTVFEIPLAQGGTETNNLDSDFVELDTVDLTDKKTEQTYYPDYNFYDLSKEKEKLIEKLQTDAFKDRYFKQYENVTGNQMTDEEYEQRLADQIAFIQGGSDMATPILYSKDDENNIQVIASDDELAKRDGYGIYSALDETFLQDLLQKSRGHVEFLHEKDDQGEMILDENGNPIITGYNIGLLGPKEWEAIELFYGPDGYKQMVSPDGQHPMAHAIMQHELSHLYNTKYSPLWSGVEGYDEGADYIKDIFGQDQPWYNSTSHGSGHTKKIEEIGAGKVMFEQALSDYGIWDPNEGEFTDKHLKKLNKVIRKNKDFLKDPRVGNYAFIDFSNNQGAYIDSPEVNQYLTSLGLSNPSTDYLSAIAGGTIGGVISNRIMKSDLSDSLNIIDQYDSKYDSLSTKKDVKSRDGDIKNWRWNKKRIREEDKLMDKFLSDKGIKNMQDPDYDILYDFDGSFISDYMYGRNLGNLYEDDEIKDGKYFTSSDTFEQNHPGFESAPEEIKEKYKEKFQELFAGGNLNTLVGILNNSSRGWNYNLGNLWNEETEERIPYTGQPLSNEDIAFYKDFETQFQELSNQLKTELYDYNKGIIDNQGENVKKYLNEIAMEEDASMDNTVMAKYGAELPKAQYGKDLIMDMQNTARLNEAGYDTTPNDLRKYGDLESAEMAASFFPVLGELIDAKNTIKATYQGRYGDAVLNAAGFMIPFIPGKVLTQGKKAVTKWMNKNAPNAYKYNPWAFGNINSKLPKWMQFNPMREDVWNRQVGRTSVVDANLTRTVREPNEVISKEEYDRIVKSLNETSTSFDISKTNRRYHGPYFQRGSLYYDYNKKPREGFENLSLDDLRADTRGKSGSADYLIQTNPKFITDEDFHESYVYTMKNTPDPVGDWFEGRNATAIMKPQNRDIGNFNFFEKDWLRGYKPLKELPNKKTGGSLPKAQTGFDMLQNHQIAAQLREKGIDPDAKGSDLSSFSDVPPIGGASHLLDILSIPGNLMAEVFEGAGGYGDKEFNFKDAMPGFSGDFSFTNMYDEPAKTVADVTDVQGFIPSLLVNVFTDPTSYIGVGLLGKAGTVTRGASKTSKVINATDNLAVASKNTPTNITKSAAETVHTPGSVHDYLTKYWNDPKFQKYQTTEMVRNARQYNDDMMMRNLYFKQRQDGVDLALKYGHDHPIVRNYHKEFVDPYPTFNSFYDNFKPTFHDKINYRSSFNDIINRQTRFGNQGMDFLNQKFKPRTFDELMDPKLLDRNYFNLLFDQMKYKNNSSLKNFKTWMDHNKKTRGLYYGRGDHPFSDKIYIQDMLTSPSLLTKRLSNPKAYSDQIKSTKIHEWSHFLDKSGMSLSSKQLDDLTRLADPFTRMKINDEKLYGSKLAKDYFYYTKPTEIKARMMELRNNFNLLPSEKFTMEHLKKSGNMFGMRPYISVDDRPELFLDIMNKYYREGGEKDVDFDQLERGIKYAESLNGELMQNKNSSASGFYGQLFSEIEDEYDGTREDFIKDTDYQLELFTKRANGELEDVPGLISNGNDLYSEYQDQLDLSKHGLSPLTIAGLSNMLGRQGTRKYIGYVLRDGKTIEEVFPHLYGENAEYPNHTPEEYITKFNKGLITKKEGGSTLRKVRRIKQQLKKYKEGKEISYTVKKELINLGLIDNQLTPNQSVR